MISDNQVDELFNDRLHNYSSSVPADMWSRIVEKKKKDRTIWLFFFGVFVFLILSIGLTGGYFIFNHKKLSAPIVADSIRMNHESNVTDTLKATRSNLPSHQVQVVFGKMELGNKKMHRKEKTQAIYEGALEHVSVNIPGKVDSSSENRSGALSNSVDSNEMRKINPEYKSDSQGKKAFVKASPIDSSNTAEIKKTKKEKKPTNGKWFLDLYASPDYPIVSPNENEKSKLSYSVGLKINRSFGKHLSIKTGIQFSRINIVTNDSLFGPLHLKRLDLPVIIGYAMGDDRFRATFNGGALINLYSWFQSESVPDFFKTNTGLSLYLGVNFERKIKEKLSLFSEPYYRYQLTSMTVSAVSGMKFIDIAGINIGARYYFKK